MTGALRDAVHAAVDLTTYLRLARNFEAVRQLSDSVISRLVAAVTNASPPTPLRGRLARRRRRRR